MRGCRAEHLGCPGQRDHGCERQVREAMLVSGAEARPLCLDSIEGGEDNIVLQKVGRGWTLEILGKHDNNV